jgi:phage shock protein PspC (stress-responsive transcriptional regulator)
MTSPNDPPTQPNPEEPAAGGPARPHGESAPHGPRRLTRSSSDRIIGGVAGGLGRHLGIDPILVRVAFVVLTFAGGAGIIAYLALLALVPADDGEPAGQGNRTTTVLATAALAVAAIVFLGAPVFVLGPGLLILALIAVAVVLVMRGLGSGDDPGRAIGRVVVAILLVIASCGAALGVAFVAALGGGIAVGILTIVTGLALVAAAFLGGARWLIVPALVLALPLAVVAAADLDFEGGVGERHYRPASPAEIDAHYQLGMGELLLDLRDVTLPAGRTDVEVDVGLGRADLRVPANVCVTSNVEIGAGAAEIFDRINDGVDVAVAQGGTPEAGQPHLHVDAHIGAGELVVHRDTFFGRAGFGPLEVACP